MRTHSLIEVGGQLRTQAALTKEMGTIPEESTFKLCVFFQFIYFLRIKAFAENTGWEKFHPEISIEILCCVLALDLSLK